MSKPELKVVDSEINPKTSISNPLSQIQRQAEILQRMRFSNNNQDILQSIELCNSMEECINQFRKEMEQKRDKAILALGGKV
jgi:hypothetical protein